MTLARRAARVGAATLLGALLLARAAAQELPLELDPVTARIWSEGRALEAGGDLVAAAVRYRHVARTDPGFVPSILALARVEAARGDLAAALEATSRSAVPEVLAARGWLELEAGRPEDAARTFARLHAAAPSGEALRGLALATAPTDPVAAAAVVRRWIAWTEQSVEEAAVAPPEVARGTVVAVALGLLDAGEGSAALALVDEVGAARPDLVDDDALVARLADLRLDEEARLWMRAAPEALVAEERARLGAARAALERGEVDTAWREARRVSERAPRSPEAWGVVAEIALARGDVAAADEALQRAEQLAPLDPAWAARLGDLLASRYGGRFRAEAAEAYARALRRDPTWAALWWRRAEVEAGVAADHGGASLRRYLALEPEGPHAEAARARLIELERQRPPVPSLPAAAPAVGVSEQASLALHRARVLFEVRGDVAAAASEAERARALAPGWTATHNLLATLRLEQGDAEGAIAAYRDSLTADPDQALPALVLWELLRREGRVEEAEAVLAAALERGIGDARFALAREAAEAGRWSAAREHLRAYALARRTGKFDLEAEALEAVVERRLAARRTALGLGAIAALLAIPALWWARRPGVGLTALVEAAPGCAAEVARIAAAVRHEVLKHDTTVLHAVADALEAGDPGPARFAAARLYGPRGTLARLDEHVAALGAVARTHGVRLDLRRADPVFAPLLDAARRLRRLRGDLEAGSARRLPELRRVAHALNEVGFTALGRLVRSLSVLVLDEPLLAEIAARVAGEPSLAGAPAVEVRAEEPVAVRMFRGEAADLVGNLLRNSLAASRDAGVGPVGLALGVEVDPVTFREQAALRVRDHAPRALSTAGIEGRSIERGLGLVMDLVRRAGGTVHVEDEPGWSKAVVVRLPAIEAAPAEEET